MRKKTKPSSPAPAQGLLSFEEKRDLPRVQAVFDLTLKGTGIAQSVDLSEGGLCMRSGEPALAPVVTLRLHFPGGNFDLESEAKLVWRRDLEEGGAFYGMEFVGLDEAARARLRRELISVQIAPLLERAAAKEEKMHVADFFLQDVLSFMAECVRLFNQKYREGEYSDEIDKRLERLCTQMLLKGYCLQELLLDQTLIRAVKDSFRLLMGPWVFKSRIMKYAFQKPRGFPGDYQMLEYLYDNKPISERSGEYFDRYFLKTPFAVALRMRCSALCERLLWAIKSFDASAVDVVNISCGPSRELRMLMAQLPKDKSVTFTCLDQDEAALRYSQDCLREPEYTNVQLKFFRKDIKDIAGDTFPFDSYGRHDLIFCADIIDYLPRRLAGRLLEVLYGLLREGGLLIFTQQNQAKTFPPLAPDWFCDWQIQLRGREEIVQLLQKNGIPAAAAAIDTDEFGYMYYVTVTRKAAKGVPHA